jgi:hypothetical protein
MTKVKCEPDSARLHMSVSRTVCLRKHQICSFVDHLRMALRREYCSEPPIEAFQGHLQALAFYRNDEQTRHFCAWSLCAKAAAEVRHIIARVDSVLAAFGLPPYREERPEPHVSFGWALPCEGLCANAGIGANAHIDQVLGNTDGAPMAQAAVAFDRVLCSVGNQTFAFQLHTPPGLSANFDLARGAGTP